MFVCFKRFVTILSEHVTHCEVNRVDMKTPWFKWVIERLQQVFFLVSLLSSCIVCYYLVVTNRYVIQIAILVLGQIANLWGMQTDFV